MFQLSFIVHHSKLAELENFFCREEIFDYSIFENGDCGFSKDLDKDSFPIANFFNVEIYGERENLCRIKQQVEYLFLKNLKSIEIAETKSEDWVKLYTDSLEPIQCENFIFYSDLTNVAPKENQIPIKLNSALAFGSGHHQTTQACIKNIIHLFQNGFFPKNVLDMGCGTGILGICAKKIWANSNLLGIDIDPEAVQVTKSNYEANNILADAIEDHELSNVEESFDLILCNILKQPLINLCPQFFVKLNNLGYIITSGYIVSQEAEIISCYENLGFTLQNKVISNEWLSILFQKNV